MQASYHNSQSIEPLIFFLFYLELAKNNNTNSELLEHWSLMDGII